MGFLDFFKPKQNNELESALYQMHELLFPRGEQDIVRDCQRIDALTNHKIPKDKLPDFVASCKVLVHNSESEKEEQFINSYMHRAEGLITENEAYEMYVYFEGEAAYYDRINGMNKQKGNDIQDPMEKHFNEMSLVYAKGTYDMIEGGYGEFGLVATNPVPTISIRWSERYIENLRYKGQSVGAIRIGSTGSDVTPGLIDVYKLTLNNDELFSIFICPYHKCNSRKHPHGFTLQIHN